ncbi:MAG: ankyrin repeat domain-containing protein [Tannerella sp.]|jgi:ankyrin repeat protein|nr:ankyrin repeat domain-containing protein [Tannerella sp.]
MTKYKYTFTPEVQQAIDHHVQTMAEAVRTTFQSDTQQAILFYWDSGGSSTYYAYYKNHDAWEKKYIKEAENETEAIRKLIQVKQSYVYFLEINANDYRWTFTKDINPEIDSDAIELIAFQEFGVEPEDDYEKEKLAKAEKQESIKKTLAYACYQDDMETLEQMLPGAKPTAIEKKIKLIGSPLHSAVINNNILMIEQLVQAGADIESTDFMRFSPLLHAIDLGHEEAARRLIDLGADIHKRGAKNHTALSLAITCSMLSRSFLDLLLQKGCNVNDMIADKISLLVLAAGCNPKGVQFLLDNDIDHSSVPEAIETACTHNNIEVMELLIPVGGTDPLSVNHSDVLYRIITGERMEMIQYLLEKGVSFYEIPEKPVKLYYNKPIKYKESPYEWAKYIGFTEIARLIEQKK